MRHSSLQMGLNYKYTQFHQFYSNNKRNISIQKILLKITSFQFLSGYYFYVIFYINIIYILI